MQFALPPLLPAVRGTIIVLFAGFLAQTLAQLGGIDLFGWLGLQTTLGIPTAWQWATHPLVELPRDGMVIGRALDLLFIYFWVTPFEQRHGTGRAVALVLLGAVAGAVLPLLLDLVVPSIAMPYAGAAAMSWAGMGGFVVLTRGQPLDWVMLPRMNAWTLAAIFLGIEAFQAAWLGTPTFLLGAVGGFGAGLAYARHLDRPAGRPPTRRARPGHLRVVPPPEPERWLN